MNGKISYKGMLYIKQGRIRTDSEGPDYFLQTEKEDFLLKYEDRYLYKPDYHLEFYTRKFVEVTGEIESDKSPRVIKVSDIQELLIALFPDAKIDHDPQMPEKIETRRISGISTHGELDEAVQNLMKEINKIMAENQIPDLLLKWRLESVQGELGGIAGKNEIRITAAIEM